MTPSSGVAADNNSDLRAFVASVKHDLLTELEESDRQMTMQVESLREELRKLGEEIAQLSVRLERYFASLH
jgi:chaperonin cofactor prefoldin